jgi:Asp-tRNA(Asn)/Glu-tRNA(Gln) amidotransferase A subunit family amidase
VSDLTRLSASLLREKIAAKKVSPVELTETVLARAESSTIQDHRYRESHSPLTRRGVFRQKSRLCVQSAF